MKASWMIVLGTVAACGVGCDDTTDGTGGSGTTSSSSSSTTSTSGTMTTGSNMTSSSTGGDPQAMACNAGAAALGMVAGDLMCDPNTQAQALAGCNKGFMDFPMCSMQLIDFWNCIGTDAAMASCSCDPMDDGVVCTGLCDAEFMALNTCTMGM